MIVYQVSIALEPGIEAEWLDWMHKTHVRDVLMTGCFSRCTLARVLDSAGPGAVFVLRYEARSRASYDRYRTEFAPALQKLHTDRYAGRFQGSRMLLEELATISV